MGGDLLARVTVETEVPRAAVPGPLSRDPFPNPIDLVVFTPSAARAAPDRCAIDMGRRLLPGADGCHAFASPSPAGVLREVPDYILQAPEQEVNRQLRQILERILITPTTVEFQIRTGG